MKIRKTNLSLRMKLAGWLLQRILPGVGFYLIAWKSNSETITISDKSNLRDKQLVLHALSTKARQIQKVIEFENYEKAVKEITGIKENYQAKNN